VIVTIHDVPCCKSCTEVRRNHYAHGINYSCNKLSETVQSDYICNLYQRDEEVCRYIKRVNVAQEGMYQLRTEIKKILKELGYVPNKDNDVL